MNRYQYRDAIKFLKEAVDGGEALITEKKSSRLIAEDVDGSAFALSYSYSKLGDFDKAKKINLEVLAPLTKGLETHDPDTPDNRFCEAALDTMKGEVASRTGDVEQARKVFSSAVDLLEKNLRVRDFPQEKAFYGGLLERFGAVLGQVGETNLGCQCIERALQILYGLRDSGLLLQNGDMSADISDGEENLRRIKERLENGGGFHR